jgi:hypothetical protein
VSRRLLFAALVAAALLPARGEADVGRAIPSGQEELLRQMLGHGARLPGNCHFAGGRIEANIVVAQYACDNQTVVIELRDAADAPADVLRTQEFAIRVRSGPAPSELPEAIATLVRARESTFEWRPVSVLQRDVFELRLGPMALALCACLILVAALFLQYAVTSRRLQRHIPPFGKEGSGGISSPRPHDPQVFATLALAAVFLFTRMSFLTVLPAYVDESVHLHWAHGFLDPDFIAEFSVGRWLPIRMMAFFLLLPVEPLFAARLGSVAMGLAVLLGCVLINRELFSSIEGLLAGIVYTALPYALLYDRLALADIYLVAFGTWAVYFSISAARRRSLAAVLATSVCINGAILSKPTGGVFLIFPILVSLFLLERSERMAYMRCVWPTLVGGAALLTFLVSAGYGTGLLTSQVAFDGRAQFTGVLIPNLAVAGEWFTALLTPPVALLAIVASAVALIAGIFGARAEAFLVLLLAVAVLPTALISKTGYPSYLLFTVVPISLLLARAIAMSASAVAWVAARVSARLSVPVKRAGYSIATLLLIWATAPLDVALATHPQDAALPSIETARYITGGLSGYGLPELAAFLRTEAQAQPLNVVRFDLVQPPKEGLDVYLPATDAIHLHTVDHLDRRAATQIADLAKTRRTLFVSNPEAETSMGASAVNHIGRAVRIWSHVRPGAETRLEVWDVQPEG